MRRDGLIVSSSTPRGERFSVLAVVVTEGVTPWLPDTLRALAAQHHAPDAVLVAVWDPSAAQGVRELVHDADLPGAQVVLAPEARTFGAGVRAALAGGGALVGGAEASPAWLWLLHDDSAPLPDALAYQLRTAEQGSSVTMVGAKQVEWDDPDHLVSVGVGLTRTGRRFTGVEPDEIDQGQYDSRLDVLAVPLAGALVRRDVWDHLGGTDPALGPYGDGADLARRARLAGHRVVVDTRAVVRHARASYLGLREPRRGAPGPAAQPDPVRSWSSRRRALLHQRLAWSALPVAVAAFLAMYLLAPLRALGRLATKEFRLIGRELRAPLAATLGLGAVARARRTARGTAVLPRRVLRPLQVGLGTRMSAARDARLNRAAQRRAQRTRSELELAEAAATARRRRLTLLAVLLGASVLALVTVGSWITDAGLIGGGVLPLDATFAETWRIATSPWLMVGDGHPVVAPPLLLLIAGMVTVLGTAPPGVAITVLLVGALPLAALGAWFAAGAATRSLWVRAWAAAAWALMPTLLVSLAQARIGAVVAHLALPWVALGVARALGVQRRDVVLSGLVGAQRKRADDDPVTSPETVGVPALGTRPVRRSTGSYGAAAAAGLLLAVACAGAPVLLPVAIVVVLALLLTLPRARAGVIASRWRLVIVVVPAIVVVGPWLTQVLHTAPDGQEAQQLLRLVLAEPGPALAHSTPEPWQVLLGWPAAPATVDGVGGLLGSLLPLVIGGTVVLAALVALLRGGGRARAVRIAWLVAAVAFAGALALRFFPAATVADGNALVTSTAWPGPLVSLVLLGLLTAAVTAFDGARGALGTRRFGVLQPVAAVVLVIVGLGPVLGGVSWVWAAYARPDSFLAQVRDADPVPALGRQVQRAPSAERVLSLVPTGSGYDVQLWRGNGPQLTDGALEAFTLEGGALDATIVGPDAASADLAIAVARLTVSADEAVPMLVEHAVGVIVVPGVDLVARPGSDATAATALAARLDATAGLERVTTNDSGMVWRVVSQDGVARARVVDADGVGSPSVQVASRDLPVGGLLSDGVRASGVLDAADGERTVVLAERADPGWRATLGGADLEPVADGWRQAFVVPPGASGSLEVYYYDAAHLPWAIVRITVLALALVVSLPTRRRDPGEDA